MGLTGGDINDILWKLESHEDYDLPIVVSKANPKEMAMLKVVFYSKNFDAGPAQLPSRWIRYS